MEEPKFHIPITNTMADITQPSEKVTQLPEVKDEDKLTISGAGDDVTMDENYTKYRAQIDPEGKHDDRILRRFFFLADRNPKLAVECANKFYSTWYGIDEAADLNKVLEEVATNKMFFGGLDKKGRRIVHFHYHMHDPTRFPVENTMKLFFLLMDVALDAKVTAEQGMVFICWMRNSGWSNFDLASEKLFTAVIDSMAPMSLKMMNKMIMVDSPWYVWVAMKLMAPFISPEVREKLAMVSEVELRSKFSKEALEKNDIFQTTVNAPDYIPWK